MNARQLIEAEPDDKDEVLAGSPYNRHNVGDLVSVDDWAGGAYYALIAAISQNFYMLAMLDSTALVRKEQCTDLTDDDKDDIKRSDVQSWLRRARGRLAQQLRNRKWQKQARAKLEAAESEASTK